MEIEFSKASFKDFENVSGMDAWERAGLFSEYLNFLDKDGRLNYRLVSVTGCGPEMNILTKDSPHPRIRMSLMATHHIAQLDMALNAFEDADKQLHLSNRYINSSTKEQTDGSLWQ